MRSHVEALFTLDGSGRLLRVNEPGGGPAPRLFIGVTEDGPDCWFRHDLDAALVEDLRDLLAIRPPGPTPTAGSEELAPVLRRLADHGPLVRTWAGPAYRCGTSRAGAEAVRIGVENADLLTPYFREWAADAARDLPFYAVVRDGKAVSICCSVRVTTRAHEAGVETHPDHRGRGHAGASVLAWASHVLAEGLTPFYSTSWHNEASLAVARKLGLSQFGSDFHAT